MRDTLARLERALIYSGDTRLRDLALSLPWAVSDWPSDLPSLPDDARSWLGWREQADFPPMLTMAGGELCMMVHLQQAITSTRDVQADLPGMIVVFDSYACDPRGSLYKLEFAEHYTATPLEFTLASFIDAIASAYEARRHSPARHLRVAAADTTRWTNIAASSQLADAAVGTAVEWGVQLVRPRGNRDRVSLAVHVGDGWRWSRTYGDDHIDAFRDDLGTAEVSAIDTPGLVALIDADYADAATKPKTLPLPLRRAMLRVWTQPPLHELLERLASSSLPLQFAPGASPAAVAGLPDELRTLYTFANGSRTAIYQRYELATLDDATATTNILLGLRSQFGDAYWHPSFVPILTKSTGDNLYVDIEGLHGSPGSVIDFNHERPSERRVLYDSVTQFFECLVEGIEAGIYLWDDEGVFPGDWEAPPQHDSVYTNNAYPWTRRLALADE